MRELWRELDSKLALSAVDGEPPLTEEELADQEAQRRLLAAGIISEIKPSRRVATGTERFRRLRSKASRVGNHHPRAPLKWLITSWIPVRSSNAMSRRQGPPGSEPWPRPQRSISFIWLASRRWKSLPPSLAPRPARMSIAEAKGHWGFPPGFRSGLRIAEITVSLLQRAALLADLASAPGLRCRAIGSRSGGPATSSATDAGFGG